MGYGENMNQINCGECPLHQICRWYCLPYN